MPRIRIIRASAGFDVVVVVVSAKTIDVHQDPKAEFYLYKEKVGKVTAKHFKNISKKTAEGYFSGHADGMGFGLPPTQGFNSFESCEKWIRKTRLRFLRQWHKKYGRSWEEIKKGFDEAFTKWFGYEPRKGPKPKSEEIHKFMESFMGGGDQAIKSSP